MKILDLAKEHGSLYFQWLEEGARGMTGKKTLARRLAISYRIAVKPYESPFVRRGDVY